MKVLEGCAFSESNQKTRTNIYITKSTLKKFQEVCKREGVKVSGKLEDFMNHYVQAHSNGNPQLRISVYAKPEEPSPIRVFCDFLRGATSDGRVHCRRRGGLWIQGIQCYSCEQNMLRKQK